MTRILSLDDEPEILELMHMIIEFSGYEHSYTTDSHAALDILRTRPIDLFTQDILRPDIRGEELCQIIRADESLCRIPMIIASANRDSGKRMVAEGYADTYVSMPFGPTELLDAIENVLQKHSLPLASEESRTRARQRWKR